MPCRIMPKSEAVISLKAATYSFFVVIDQGGYGERALNHVALTFFFSGIDGPKFFFFTFFLTKMMIHLSRKEGKKTKNCRKK